LDELSAPSHREACGFRNGHQVAEIAEALRIGLEKPKLYGQEFTIIQAVVLKAFDYMSHDEIRRSLEYYGIPQRLQHSLLLELAGTVMFLVLEHVAASCPVLLFAAGKQGGTETPALWNRILDARLAEAAQTCRHEGLGWKLVDEGYADEDITHFSWADDVYIVSNTMEGAKRMFEHFSTSIEQAGLRWKPESLKVLSNMCGDVFVESWNTCVGPLELQHVTSFIALGVAIDNLGSTDCAVNHRVGCFWVSWSALKSKFCSRRIPLTVRISRFYDTLVRSLLFNAGGWTPGERLLRRIGGIELRCLRAMGGRTTAPEESNHDFFSRLDSAVCGIRDRLHILPASVQLCGLYLGWAGLVAKLPAQRQMSIVHCWRSLDRFRTSQLLGSSADGTDRRRLANVGRPSRWENIFGDLIGSHWAELCHDRPAWARLKTSLALSTFAKLMHRKQDMRLESGTATAHISPAIRSNCLKLGAAFDIPVLHLADNMQLVCQTSGLWKPSSSWQCDLASKQIRLAIHSLVKNGKAVVWDREALFLKHVPRAQNSLADRLANAALDTGAISSCRVLRLKDGDKLALFTDGARRGNPGRSSIGCAIVLYRPKTSPLTIAVFAKATGHGTNTNAEFDAGVFGWHILKERLQISFLNSHCMISGSHRCMANSILKINSTICEFDDIRRHE
jgi:ribonuclease HI